MSIQEDFIAFHEANPQVYETLLALCQRWQLRYPNRTCGIGMLWEVMRWTLSMQTNGEPYKLNNNYRSRYARMLIEEYDIDIFNVRELKSA